MLAGAFGSLNEDPVEEKVGGKEKENSFPEEPPGTVGSRKGSVAQVREEMKMRR